VAALELKAGQRHEGGGGGGGREGAGRRPVGQDRYGRAGHMG
jgi:hypothetical protein